jgi:signal transduction histidine kinase
MISKHSRKITISFVIVLGLSLAMIIFDLSRMKIMQANLDVIINEQNVKSALMMTIQHGIYERQVSLRDIMLMDDPFERDEAKMEFSQYAVDILTARNKFKAMPLNEKEKKVLSEIQDEMILAYQARTKLIDTSIYQDKITTKEELQKVFLSQERLMNKVKEMIALQKSATEKAVLDAKQSYSEAKSSVYILGGSSLLFGLFVAIFIIRLTGSQTRSVKEAMSEIEESHRLLEERVHNRTKELAKVRDEALSSNKAKDDFLATMSHELRTPLNIILGYSELLSEIAEEDGYKNLIPDLNKIEHAAHHQLKLVNSLLDISKIEEGKIDINPIDFDVEKLLLEIVHAAKPLMAENNNSFEIKCMHGIGMMYSDNMRLKQILINLIGNAAKFTNEGKVLLSVTKDLKSEEITFIVKDSGIGIPTNYIIEVFEKFTQADSSTTRKYGGSGLGLSISKKLSHELNGDLTVESEEGNGSCFTLTLPIVYIE